MEDLIDKVLRLIPKTNIVPDQNDVAIMLSVFRKEGITRPEIFALAGNLGLSICTVEQCLRWARLNDVIYREGYRSYFIKEL